MLAPHHVYRGGGAGTARKKLAVGDQIIASNG